METNRDGEERWVMGGLPSVSVIVPTHNRRAALLRLLGALSTQTYPADGYQVVVVADGGTDSTVVDLCGRRTPYALTTLSQRRRGPAAARNRGAAAATGDLLLFLDDDVEPAPTLIEAHVLAHRQASQQVVLGYLPVVRAQPSTFYSRAIHAWWEQHFQRLRRPDHRDSYQDLLAANFSLGRAHFWQVGGFDPGFSGCSGEDWELGVRLLAAGARFTFAEQAMARHHDTVELAGALQRKRQDGRGHLRILRRHPALWPTLPLARFSAPHSPLGHLLLALAFRLPALGDQIAACLLAGLGTLEQAGLHRSWHRLYHALCRYWYLRGLAEQGGASAVACARHGGPHW